MYELIFIGLGLFDEKDISIRGLEELKDSETVFAEMYTSLMPKISIKRLESMIGKKINIINRKKLEEEEGDQLFEAVEKGKTALLVQGDPMISTTHIDLRIRAKKKGIKTRVIHAASVLSAVRGTSGLQNYKFGKSVTIPFSEYNFKSETPYNVIYENKKMGLHTLCYLDLKADEEKYLTINQALKILLELEHQKNQQIITKRTLIIGIARVGSPDFIVRAGYIEKMITYYFGAPPHTIVFPGKLHFMEAEALVELANGPSELLEINK